MSEITAPPNATDHDASAAESNVTVSAKYFYVQHGYFVHALVVLCHSLFQDPSHSIVLSLESSPLHLVVFLGESHPLLVSIISSHVA